MKAVLSNKIYLNEPKTGIADIVEPLTYKIKHKATGAKRPAKIETIFNFKRLPKGIICIPGGRPDLIPKNYEIIDRRVYMPVPFPNPTLQLRPDDQLPIYEAAVDSCIINAKVGFGKTFLALHIARKLGQKTLIVCHTTMLRDQWIDEAKRLFNMPIGKIGAGVCDIEDHAIVVGNVQSVTKLSEKLAKEFGTIIIDECHHISASTFSDILEKSYARYKIGLSGTLRRRDGRHILFQDYFGHLRFSPAVSGTREPKVRLLHTGISLPTGLGWAQKINQLLYDEDYQKYVAKVAETYIEMGHIVLIPASRVEFLQKITELLNGKVVCITGGTSREERQECLDLIEAGICKGVAGSKQIWAEGISANRLSAILLCEPQSAEGGSLEQLIGRVQRNHPEKILDPIVVDFQFSDPSSRAQSKAKIAFYVEQDWDVTSI